MRIYSKRDPHLLMHCCSEKQEWRFFEHRCEHISEESILEDRLSIYPLH